jgi:hypothetical protein
MSSWEKGSWEERREGTWAWGWGWSKGGVPGPGVGLSRWEVFCRLLRDLGGGVGTSGVERPLGPVGAFLFAAFWDTGHSTSCSRSSRDGGIHSSRRYRSERSSRKAYFIVFFPVYVEMRLSLSDLD